MATAAALIAALLAALFFLPKPWFAALGALIAAAAGFEWARLCRLAGTAAWAYAAAMAFAFVVLYNTEPRQPAFLLAALFWIVAVPWWLRRGVQGRGLAVAGFVVILPAALAFVILKPLEVLLVLLLVWIADSAAYFVGRAPTAESAPKSAPARPGKAPQRSGGRARLLHHLRNVRHRGAFLGAVPPRRRHCSPSSASWVTCSNPPPRGGRGEGQRHASAGPRRHSRPHR